MWAGCRNKWLCWFVILFPGDNKVVNGDKDAGSGGEEEGEIVAETEVFYDKSKSFFDSISCDATERAKG